MVRTIATFVAAAGLVLAQGAGGAGKEKGKGGGGAPPAAPQMISQLKPGLFLVTGLRRTG